MKNFEKILVGLTVAVSCGALVVAILSFLNSKDAKEKTLESQQPDVRISYTITNKLNFSELFENDIAKSRVISSDFYERENEKDISVNRNFCYLWLVFHNIGPGYASDLKISKIKYKFEGKEMTITNDIRIDKYAAPEMGTPPIKMHPDEAFALLVLSFEPVNSQGEKIHPLKYIKDEMAFEGFKTEFYHLDVYSKEYAFEDEETDARPRPDPYTRIE